jgi:phosphoadenosine phosphosulfate reductase
MVKALQFSGGKDSIACLYLLRDEWPTLRVVWVNTGAAYPDMVDYMEVWKKILPHFVEVRTNQPEQIARNGFPSDVVVVNDTAFGRQFINRNTPVMQPYLNCCAENIWFPLMQAMHDIGATEIVRGQRKSDARKSFIQPNDVIDGVRYTFPIYGWTDEEVFAYLKNVGALMPEAYARGEKTGRDCWDCTAYLDDNAQRIRNLSPERRAVVVGRIRAIRSAVMETELINQEGAF